nr:PEPxxWA-CTERM sorting domain-containing protein [Sphingomonas vulcanisoli]
MVVNTPIALGLATISASQAALYDDHYQDYYDDAVYLGTSGPPDPANPDYQSLPGTLTISSPESFLAVDLGSFFGTTSYYYTVNNQQSGYITLAQGVSTFIGITGDGPITLSLIQMANDEVDVVHSYTSSATSDIPETASWVMMIGGFGLVGAALRRRRIALVRLT